MIPTPRGMPRRWSASTPGRIAAAMMKARNSRAISTFSFHSARAVTTTPTKTTAAMKARRAVFRIRGNSRRKGGAPGEAGCVRVESGEQVCLDSRRHGAVLTRPFVRAFLLCGVGVALILGGTAAAVVGAFALTLAALVALR